MMRAKLQKLNKVIHVSLKMSSIFHSSPSESFLNPDSL
eukprot:UN13621